MKTFSTFRKHILEGSDPTATLMSILRLAFHPATPKYEQEAAEHRGKEYAKAKGLNYEACKAQVLAGFTSGNNRSNTNSGASYNSGQSNSNSGSNSSSNSEHPNRTKLRNLIMSMHVLSRALGYEFAGPVGSMGMKCLRWRYTKDSRFSIKVPSTDNPPETKAEWYFFDDYITSAIPHKQGEDADELRYYLAHLDYDKLAKENDDVREEERKASYAPITEKQQEVQNLLFSFEYELNPPSEPQSRTRLYTSKDHNYSIFVSPDGGYFHYSLIAGKRKKTAGQGPQSLSALRALLVNLKETKAEPKAHANPTMDLMIKYLLSKGYIKEDTGISNTRRVFRQPTLKIRVALDRSNRGFGKIKKDEEIAWTVSFQNIRKSEYGVGYESFILEMEKHGTVDMGVEAMEKLIAEYGFKPKDESTISAKFTFNNYKWFTVGERVTKNWVTEFALGFHKFTGVYTLLELGLPSFRDGLPITAGSDVDVLRAALTRFGFKPHQAGESESQSKGFSVLELIDNVATKFGYKNTGDVQGAGGLVTRAYTHTGDKNSTIIVELGKNGLNWKLSYFDYGIDGWKTVATGFNDSQLSIALKAHDSTMKSRAGAQAQMCIEKAKDFNFRYEPLAAGDNIIMIHVKDNAVIEIDKEHGGWEFYFRRKVIGSGLTPGALQTFLEETYGTEK